MKEKVCMGDRTLLILSEASASAREHRPLSVLKRILLCHSEAENMFRTADWAGGESSQKLKRLGFGGLMPKGIMVTLIRENTVL